MRNPWRTLDSRLVYENPWIKVTEDRVLRPDGLPGIYGIVDIAPAVGVLALSASREVALVGQWRYTRKRFCWELPLGGSKSTDASLLQAAQRELREETGYVAEEWRQLGVLDSIVGVTTERATFFLARELRHVGSQQDPEEEIVVRWVPFDEALEMVDRDEITEAVSVAALLRAERLLRS
jgi:8-oxo-dGTP pyrophosphatase MutT (NUDIX family)